MKPKLFLFCFFVLIFTSCQKSTLTDERIIELLWCIPDHGLSDTAEKYMTEDLYYTLEEAYSIPTDPEYIGDEEFLYYFMTGNGMMPDERDAEIIVSSMQDETHAEARVICTLWEKEFEDYKEKSMHKLSLFFENGAWKLDDFDNQKARCKEYNRTH